MNDEFYSLEMILTRWLGSTMHNQDTHYEVLYVRDQLPNEENP